MVFDEYPGPALFTDARGRKVVPIPPSARDFFRSSVACQRVQLPLVVAHAITVHKSQGLTMSRAVVDISRGEHQSGLNYVAVSRVKTLQGLVFDAPFDLEQLQRPAGRRDTQAVQARLQDWVRRDPQVLLPPARQD